MSALLVAALLVSIPPRVSFAATDPAQAAVFRKSLYSGRQSLCSSLLGNPYALLGNPYALLGNPYAPSGNPYASTAITLTPIVAILQQIAGMGNENNALFNSWTGKTLAILQQIASMGNPNQAPFNTWTGGDPCGAPWDGVRCSAGGGSYDVVTELFLEDAKLTGTLPPSLFDLTSLHTM
ncbi:unnamed protein product [Closterium sp. NIES-64]|nr:unnamed protein product [Closterium sp. NIES-64]